MNEIYVLLQKDKWDIDAEWENVSWTDSAEVAHAWKAKSTMHFGYSFERLKKEIVI